MNQNAANIEALKSAADAAWAAYEAAPSEELLFAAFGADQAVREAGYQAKGI